MSARPLEQIHGFVLTVGEIAAAWEFISEHHAALVDHGTGEINSFDLLDKLGAARRPP